jgi:glucosamine--fructose-6-phosphate aminotransferase (isomerizing)
MCGIVGYIGKRNAVPLLINGLKRLEYRGYDSAGVAVIEGGRVHVRKTKGKIADLAALMKERPAPEAVIGIAHTRWATHGAPNDINRTPPATNCLLLSITASSKIICALKNASCARVTPFFPRRIRRFWPTSSRSFIRGI